MRKNSVLIEPTNLIFSKKLAQSVADEEDDGKNIDVYDESDNLIQLIMTEDGIK